MSSSYSLSTALNLSPNMAMQRLREEGFSLVLTGRGWLLLLFAAYLILVPVLEHSDIVAAMLGFFLLSTLVLMAVITLVLASKLRRNFEVKLKSTDELVSASGPQQLRITLGAYNLPLLWRLALRVEFARADMHNAWHILNGKSSQTSTLTEWVSIPHRGVWRASNLRLTISDQFCLTRVAWDRRLTARDGTLRVAPPERHTPLLPIISSSYREGDLATDEKSRSGDPFDLKRYHPSDGMKRILWKVFARSGELISRHPEPSINPEGQVVLFVMAQTEDDELSARAISYVKMLEELQLGVFAGCQGSSSRPIAHSSRALKTLLIDSAWDSNREELDCMHDIDSLIASHAEHSHHSTLQKILIFICESRTYQENQIMSLTRIGMHLGKKNIQPAFCVYTDKQTANQHALETDSKVIKLAKKFLVHTPESIGKSSIRAGRSNFFELAQRLNWLVIRCN